MQVSQLQATAGNCMAHNGSVEKLEPAWIELSTRLLVVQLDAHECRTSVVVSHEYHSRNTDGNEEDYNFIL